MASTKTRQKILAKRRFSTTAPLDYTRLSMSWRPQRCWLSGHSFLPAVLIGEGVFCWWEILALRRGGGNGFLIWLSALGCRPSALSLASRGFTEGEEQQIAALGWQESPDSRFLRDQEEPIRLRKQRGWGHPRYSRPFGKLRARPALRNRIVITPTGRSSRRCRGSAA